MTRRRVDVAVLAADLHGDAWAAMADSYAYLGRALVGVCQKVGPVTLSPGWEERADGFVVIGDPIGKKGADRLVAVPRVEVADLAEEQDAAVARLRRRWEYQYGLGLGRRHGG